MLDKCKEAFQMWYLTEMGHFPPPALNCETHKDMTYGNIAAESAWLGFKGAYYNNVIPLKEQLSGAITLLYCHDLITENERKAARDKLNIIITANGKSS